MKNILIRYNPFSQKTALLIDGMAQVAEGGRFQGYVLNHPMDRWLSPGVNSYQRWDGFLPELMETLNEDELEIQFEGTRQDGLRFRQELQWQHRAVEDRGYDAEVYVLKIQEWDLSHIRNDLLAFSEKLEENMITGTAYKRLILLKEILGREPSVETLKICRTMVLEMIQDNWDYCVQQEEPTADMQMKKYFWAEAGKNIHQIFQAF